MTAENSLLLCEISNIDNPVQAKSLIASAVLLMAYSLKIDGPA